MRNSTAATLAKVIKSISHPIRLKILCLLVDGEQTVSHIHEQLATSYANASQHLQRLQNQGLVVTVRQSNFVYYAIAAPHIREMILALRRLYCGGQAQGQIGSTRHLEP